MSVQFKIQRAGFMGVIVLRYGSWVWVSAAASLSFLCHICVRLGARSSFHPSIFLFLFP